MCSRGRILEKLTPRYSEWDLQGEGSGRCRAHISGPDGDPLVVRIHAWNDDRHAPGTSEAQYVGFLGGGCALGQPCKGRGLPGAGVGTGAGGRGERQVETHINHSCQLLP